MSRDHGSQYVVSPDPAVDEVEVMPVSEHEDELKENEEELTSYRREVSRLREALLAIEVYARPPHENIAEACGVDLCTACLIHGTAKGALE